MESFTKDLQGILSELNDADKQANEIIVVNEKKTYSIKMLR